MKTRNTLYLLITGCALLLGSCTKKEETQPQPNVAVSAISPSSGPKATAVTITGSGFSTVATENTVTINGLACPVTSATATELKITIPVKAGDGNIQVKVKDKTAQSALFTYVYTAKVTTIAGSTQGDGDKFN